MRAFFTGVDDAILIQMMATCGRVPIAAVDRCRLSQLATELCPLPIADVGDGARMIKDLCQASQFPESLIHPPKHIAFQSSGRKDQTHFQVPRESKKLLNF